MATSESPAAGRPPGPPVPPGPPLPPPSVPAQTGPLNAASNDTRVPALIGIGAQTPAPGAPNYYGECGVFGASSSWAGVSGDSTSGIGVSGSSTSGTGVSGDSTSGTGVSGTSHSSGVGVSGLSGSGVGVSGDSNGGNGVQGTSVTSAGVSGSSDLGDGVQGNSTSGVGVRGASVNGIAGYFTGNSNLAIQAVGKAENFDAIVAQTSSSAHAAVSAQNSNGGYGLWAISNSDNASGGVGGIALFAKGHKYAAQFEGSVYCHGDHHCTGTLSVDVDIVLPASDCAEEFEVEPGIDIDLGNVMVLGDREVLKPCTEPYDRKVAGVISGAGDSRPGLILGRRDGSARRHPVALVGRVFCRVDAKYSPVEIGDLLTTSPTPGHAMKASDPSLAFGAVIDKALGQLSEGCALIPILVALQ